MQQRVTTPTKVQSKTIPWPVLQVQLTPLQRLKEHAFPQQQLGRVLKRTCICMLFFQRTVRDRTPCLVLSLVLNWTLWQFSFFFFWIKFSISMYIMCVCLFSALSCRVGTLQISIIIIIIKRTSFFWKTVKNLELNSKDKCFFLSFPWTVRDRTQKDMLFSPKRTVRDRTPKDKLFPKNSKKLRTQF